MPERFASTSLVFVSSMIMTRFDGDDRTTLPAEL
jgi:hypothetical protein